MPWRQMIDAELGQQDGAAATAVRLVELRFGSFRGGWECAQYMQPFGRCLRITMIAEGGLISGSVCACEAL